MQSLLVVECRYGVLYDDDVFCLQFVTRQTYLKNVTSIGVQGLTRWKIASA
jgi:hypothetical protein